VSWWSDIVPQERHEQRVFAFVIVIESLLLIICVTSLALAMFFRAENGEAMTALVSITNMLIGSFATLMAARGLLKNGKGNGEK
jgi:hypothetical protein